MKDKIKSGDRFKYEGKEYECVGTDEGKIWYPLDGINEYVWAEPSECKKIVAEQSEGELWSQMLDPLYVPADTRLIIPRLMEKYRLSPRSEKVEAVEFAQWTQVSGYKSYGDGINEPMHWKNAVNERFSTEQLYNLFKQKP